MRHERDYVERTIATVRNHRSADNCWPQWANIFADEIERLWRVEEALTTARRRLRTNAVAWHTKFHERRVDFEACDVTSCTNDQEALALIDAALANPVAEEGIPGGLIHQPTRREMGVDAPDFGEPLGNAEEGDRE